MVYLFFQHAHIENIKTVANLTNNKDVFMCILRFHARAGYLQTYESLLKEVNAHPGSAPVDDDQYQVECAALSDRNFQSGLRDWDSLPFPCRHAQPSINDVANVGNVP